MNKTKAITKRHRRSKRRNTQPTKPGDIQPQITKEHIAKAVVPKSPKVQPLVRDGERRRRGTREFSLPRRKNKRMHISRRVQFHVDGQPVEAFTRDISGGGFFIRAAEPLPVGTQSEFKLQLQNAGAPIILPGDIIRVEEGQGTYGMAVKFEAHRGEPVGDYVLKTLEHRAVQKLRLNPFNVAALRDLGDIYAERGQREEALEFYHQVTALEEGAHDAQARLGQLMFQLSSKKPGPLLDALHSLYVARQQNDDPSIDHLISECRAELQTLIGSGESGLALERKQLEQRAEQLAAQREQVRLALENLRGQEADVSSKREGLVQSEARLRNDAEALRLARDAFEQEMKAKRIAWQTETRAEWEALRHAKADQQFRAQADEQMLQEQRIRLEGQRSHLETQRERLDNNLIDFAQKAQELQRDVHAHEQEYNTAFTRLMRLGDTANEDIENHWERLSQVHEDLGHREEVLHAERIRLEQELQNAIASAHEAAQAHEASRAGYEAAQARIEAESREQKAAWFAELDKRRDKLEHEIAMAGALKKELLNHGPKNKDQAERLAQKKRDAHAAMAKLQTARRELNLERSLVDDERKQLLAKARKVEKQQEGLIAYAQDQERSAWEFYNELERMRVKNQRLFEELKIREDTLRRREKYVQVHQVKLDEEREDIERLRENLAGEQELAVRLKETEAALMQVQEELKDTQVALVLAREEPKEDPQRKVLETTLEEKNAQLAQTEEEARGLVQQLEDERVTAAREAEEYRQTNQHLHDRLELLRNESLSRVAKLEAQLKTARAQVEALRRHSDPTKRPTQVYVPSESWLQRSYGQVARACRAVTGFVARARRTWARMPLVARRRVILGLLAMAVIASAAVLVVSVLYSNDTTQLEQRDQQQHMRLVSPVLDDSSASDHDMLRHPLKREVVRQSFLGRPAVEACLEGARERGEIFGGIYNVTASWTITPEGVVTDTVIDRPRRAKRGMLGLCLRQVIGSWTFRPTQEGASIESFSLGQIKVH